MVKQITYLFIFLFLFSFGIAQKAPDLKMSVADYQKAETIKDLIKAIPADCKIISYEVYTPINGVLISTVTNSENISWNRENAKAGNKIIIEISRSTCPKSIKSKYIIKLE